MKMKYIQEKKEYNMIRSIKLQLIMLSSIFFFYFSIILT